MSEELREELARKAVQLPLSRMFGGCINPTDNTRGECADGECWCARVSRHIADNAISLLRPRLRDEALEEAAKYHDERIEKIRRKISDVWAAVRAGHWTEADGAAEVLSLKSKIATHRIAAAALRAMKGKADE